MGTLGATLLAVLACTVRLYQPFVCPGIAPGVRVVRSAAGYRWTTSSSTSRSDAFRCFVGNLLYDPCLAASAAAASHLVLCPMPTPGSGGR